MGFCNEIIWQIMLYVNPKQLWRICCTCQDARDISTDHVWQREYAHLHLMNLRRSQLYQLPRVWLRVSITWGTYEMTQHMTHLLIRRQWIDELMQMTTYFYSYHVLHEAVQLGNTEVVKRLYDTGWVDLSYANNRAIKHAVASSYLDLVCFLKTIPRVRLNLGEKELSKINSL